MGINKIFATKYLQRYTSIFSCYAVFPIDDLMLTCDALQNYRGLIFCAIVGLMTNN